ncbi:MAG: hypothetical protein RLP44_16855 [Aggregatilineales bacterium]
MELLQILRILLRRWWIVILPVIVAAIIVVPDFLRDAPSAGGFNTTIRYTAAQVLEAIPERDGDFQDVWLASELAVNAFTDWVRTGSFKDDVAEVAAQNGVEVNSAALGLAADNARSIGQVFLSYPVENDLAVVVNSAIEVLQTRNQDYFPQLGGVSATVVVLDAPVITAAPPPLTDRFGAIIRLGVALFAGVGLAFLVEYLDPTLRTKDDLEALGIPVITSIPR